MKTYKAIEITTKNTIKEFGILKVLWGTDLFINGIPVVKLLFLLNALGFLILRKYSKN